MKRKETHREQTCGWQNGREAGRGVDWKFGVSRCKLGFPGGASGKEPTCQCRRPKRCRFDPGIRKIPFRRAWQPTPVFLPGESHRQRILVGYSSWGHKESDTTEWLHFFFFLTYDKCYVYVSISSYSLPLHYALSSVQLLSHVWFFATPWTAAR